MALRDQLGCVLGCLLVTLATTACSDGGSGTVAPGGVADVASQVGDALTTDASATDAGRDGALSDLDAVAPETAAGETLDAPDAADGEPDAEDAAPDLPAPVQDADDVPVAPLDVPDALVAELPLIPDVIFLPDFVLDTWTDPPADVVVPPVDTVLPPPDAPDAVPPPPDVVVQDVAPPADTPDASPDSGLADVADVVADTWVAATDAEDTSVAADAAEPPDAAVQDVADTSEPPADLGGATDVGWSDAQAADDVPTPPPADTAIADDVPGTDVAVADVPLPDVEVPDDGPAADLNFDIEDAADADAAAAADADDADVADGATEPPLPDFYDPAYIPQIELTVDAAAMAVLTDTSIATQKTWVHASFKCEGVTIADVGLRRKGASTFRAVPQKAAFKIKFNKWVKGVKFRGYTDLTLNNMVDDSTGLRERLSYYVYRSLGVPAPKCNTATVTLNGVAYGPYANIETPDKDMLTTWFGAKTKNLYEIDEGSEWMPGSEVGFIIDFGDATKADALALFQAVAAAKDSDLIAGVQNNLDVDEWLRYSAIEAVTAQCDNYAFGVYGSHNYFMAGDINGIFSLMPWSADLSFSDSISLVDAANPLPADPVYTAPTLLMRCKNSAACWDAYKSHVANVIAAYQNLNLASVAQTWHDQIDALQANDVKRESSLNYYQQSVTLLYQWIDARPAIVKQQLNLP